MNKYEVLGSVGEGAYGIVMKCRNRETGEMVAVKKFKESEEDEMVKKTTMREVKVLRILRNHTGIVNLLEAFRRKGRLYLVFEYVGRNLLEVLEENPQGLPPDLVRRYSFMLTQAVHSCHSANVLHRDIKPENLLINSKERSLKLCDFGFARLMHTPCYNDDGSVNTSHMSNSSTGASSVGPLPEYTDYVATRWYRSPELLLGTNHYDEKVDMWAVGCIVSEMFDGQALFPGESEADQLHVIQKTIGNLSDAQTAAFYANPRFSAHTLPRVSRPETLEKHHNGRLTRKAIHFMKCLLHLNPAKRACSADALQHPWFEGLGESVGPTPSAPPTQSSHRPRSGSASLRSSSMRTHSVGHSSNDGGDAPPARHQHLHTSGSPYQQRAPDHPLNNNGIAYRLQPKPSRTSSIHRSASEFNPLSRGTPAPAPHGAQKMSSFHRSGSDKSRSGLGRMSGLGQLCAQDEGDMHTQLTSFNQVPHTHTHTQGAGAKDVGGLAKDSARHAKHVAGDGGLGKPRQGSGGRRDKTAEERGAPHESTAATATPPSAQPLYPQLGAGGAKASLPQPQTRLDDAPPTRPARTGSARDAVLRSRESGGVPSAGKAQARGPLPLSRGGSPTAEAGPSGLDARVGSASRRLGGTAPDVPQVHHPRQGSASRREEPQGGADLMRQGSASKRSGSGKGKWRISSMQAMQPFGQPAQPPPVDTPAHNDASLSPTADEGKELLRAGLDDNFYLFNNSHSHASVPDRQKVQPLASQPLHLSSHGKAKGGKQLPRLHPQNDSLGGDYKRGGGQPLFLPSGAIRSLSVNRPPPMCDDFTSETAQRPSSGSQIHLTDMLARPFSGKALGIAPTNHPRHLQHTPTRHA